MRTLLASLSFVLGAAAVPAAAQTVPAAEQTVGARPPVRQAPRNRVGFRVYFFTDSSSIDAKETFDAVFDKTRIVARGGGGEVLNLWRGVFARVGVSSTTLEGTRVIVVDGQVIPLGIPLTLKMTPIEIGAGWRFAGVAPPWFTPYIGAGMVRLGYDESSAFAQPGENLNESFTGYSVYGGADVRLWRLLTAGAEVQYRTIDAIGEGGVSQAFGESNLGGVTLRVLIGISR